MPLTKLGEEPGQAGESQKDVPEAHCESEGKESLAVSLENYGSVHCQNTNRSLCAPIKYRISQDAV